MSDGTKIAWTEATWNPIRARDSAGTTALAFIDGKGPQPGSQIAHLLAGDKEATDGAE